MNRVVPRKPHPLENKEEYFRRFKIKEDVLCGVTFVLSKTSTGKVGAEFTKFEITKPSKSAVFDNFVRQLVYSETKDVSEFPDAQVPNISCTITFSRKDGAVACHIEARKQTELDDANKSSMTPEDKGSLGQKTPDTHFPELWR